jgi:hypothetical protein
MAHFINQSGEPPLNTLKAQNIRPITMLNGWAPELDAILNVWSD